LTNITFAKLNQSQKNKSMNSCNQKYFGLIILILFIRMMNVNTAKAQFWTEDFVPVNTNANNFADGYTGANSGNWTITALPGNNVSGLANVWYISCQEASVLPNYCGGSCLTIPAPLPSPLIGQSLHISSGVLSDNGAIYIETGSSQTDTEILAESPTINCTGQSNIVLSFNYIEFGDGLNDNAQVWYFDGLNWSMLADMPKTLCGDASGPCNTNVCDGISQGYWTAFSVALPISADNNPNVKIGFYWKNIDDGIATDPSIAVGRIQLSNGVATKNNQQNDLSNNQTIVLEQNIPNPFVEKTLIHFQIPKDSKSAQLLFYDSFGKLIRTSNLKTEEKGKIEFYNNELKAGVYSYTLIIDGKIIETKKMIKQK